MGIYALKVDGQLKVDHNPDLSYRASGMVSYVHIYESMTEAVQAKKDLIVANHKWGIKTHSVVIVDLSKAPSPDNEGSDINYDGCSEM